jgi:hypothetical protein
MTNWFRVAPFIALIPGFFAYHWAGINGWVPFLLRGYVNEISLLVVSSYAIVTFLKSVKQQRLVLNWTTTDTYFSLFMSWFICVLLVNAILETAPAVTKSHTAAALQMMACYMVMRHVELDKVRNISLWLTVLFSLFVLWPAQSDILDLTRLISENNESKAATYQDLARSFLITSAVGLTAVNSKFWRWFGYAMSVAVLFILGARSEIFGAIFLFVIFEVSISRSPLVAIVVIMIICTLSVILIYSSLEQLEDFFPNNRLIGLILLSGGDASVVERSQYQLIAWQAVMDSPLIGDYGHYGISSTAGAYAHNWLSVWVDLGLVGILLFFLLYIGPIKLINKVFGNYKSIKCDIAYKNYSLAFGLLFMFTVFIFYAKSFTDPGIATALGLFSSLQTNYFKRNWIFRRR